MFNQNENKITTQKIEVWAQDIQGIVYYIDKSNNVYQAEDVIINKINPTFYFILISAYRSPAAWCCGTDSNNISSHPATTMTRVDQHSNKKHAQT